MIALDDSMIREFYRMNMLCAEQKYTQGERQVYAIPRDSYVVITTLGLLVAWPYELVDHKSVELARLFKITEANGQLEILKKLKRTPWTFLYAKHENAYFDCEELDQENGHCVYQARGGKQKFYYAPPCISLIEKIWSPVMISDNLVETMSKKIYIGFGMHPLPGYLVIYENGRKRGLLANSIL